MSRFLKSNADKMMHWVILYDSLEDDLFEGTLGIDEGFDYPRILVEYTIVRS